MGTEEVATRVSSSPARGRATVNGISSFLVATERPEVSFENRLRESAGNIDGACMNRQRAMCLETIYWAFT